ncbi:hypothetical protein ACHAXT_009650 [Thalassiosira profunda]
MIDGCLSGAPAATAATTTASLACPEELAAAEACMPGDLSDIDCTLCGVDAWGDNFENLFDNEGYCAAWTACAEKKCPAECLDEWNAYTACQLDFDCLGASGGALSTAPAAETTTATAPMDLEAPTLVDGALVTVQSPYDVDRGWTVISDDYVELAQESATVFKLVVPGLTGQPGYYLRHSGFFMRSKVDDGSELFKNDATFVLEAGLNSGIDRVSFRSVNFPSMFITHNDLGFYEIYRLIIKTEFLSADYRRPATFLLQDAGAGLVTTTTPTACTDTTDYEDMYGDGCDYYESDPNYPLFCESFGANGEAGSTPNENCCTCIAAIGATVPASTTPQATTTTTQQTTTTTAATTTSASEPDPPGVVEGYDYVGYGGCLDVDGADYPSVQQTYTFSAGECGQFCDKFGPTIVDSADGVLRGFTWGGILGDINLHCTCVFDVGSDVEKLANELGGAREHWGSMVPAKPNVGGDGTGPPTLLSKSQYDNFCYKVGENLETTVSGLSTVPPVDAGAPDPTGSSADECAAEAAAVEACTPTDLSALEAYLECALCGVEAMGEDVLSLNEADYCAKWTPCTVERCPVKCQDPLNALQACELGWDCLGTASGKDGATETSDEVDSSARAVVVNASATGLLAIAAVFVLC